MRRGVVGWLRANLFNGPFNSVASLLTIVLLAMVLWPLAKWALIDADWLGSTVRLVRARALAGCSSAPVSKPSSMASIRMRRDGEWISS